MRGYRKLKNSYSIDGLPSFGLIETDGPVEQDFQDGYYFGQLNGSETKVSSEAREAYERARDSPYLLNSNTSELARQLTQLVHEKAGVLPQVNNPPVTSNTTGKDLTSVIMLLNIAIPCLAVGCAIGYFWAMENVDTNQICSTVV